MNDILHRLNRLLDQFGDMDLGQDINRVGLPVPSRVDDPSTLGVNTHRDICQGGSGVLLPRLPPPLVRCHQRGRPCHDRENQRPDQFPQTNPHERD